MLMKPAHRRGTYHRRAARVRAAAYLNPDTRCQAPAHICKGWGNRTLAEHPNTSTGKPPGWDAGHVRAGDPTSPLEPWVDICNRSEGGSISVQRRRYKALTVTQDW